MTTTIYERMDLAAAFADPGIDLIDEAAGQALLDQMIKDEQKLYAAIELTRHAIDAAHSRLGRGNQRRIYRGEACVYKLPLVDALWRQYLTNPERYLQEYVHPDDVDGFPPAQNINANLCEVWAFETGALSLPLAPCRLVWHASGIPIVVMERLNMRRRTDFPNVHGFYGSDNWDDVYEGGQIGWSSLLGSWAGFDAGMPPDGMMTTSAKWVRQLQRKRARQMQMTSQAAA